MKPIFRLFLLSLLLATAGCATMDRVSVQTQDYGGSTSPTEAQVFVEQAKATPQYLRKIDLAQVTDAVNAGFANSGQKLSSDINTSNYVVTATVIRLWDLFDNCVTLNLKVTNTTTKKTVYSADYEGVSLTQGSSLSLITSEIAQSSPGIFSSINADYSGGAQATQVAQAAPAPEGAPAGGDTANQRLSARVEHFKKAKAAAVAPAPAQERPAGLGRAQAAPAEPAPAPAEAAPAPDVAEPAPAPAQPAPDPGGIAFGRYRALVIGINKYRSLPPLQTAVRDAEAVAAALRQDYGFEVQLLRDSTRAEIVTALGRLRQEMGEGDNLLIYYAGHGWLDSEADEGYWLPADATRDNEVNWVPNAFVTSTLKAIQAKHVLVVADSCYSGKLARGLNITRMTPDYLERIAAKRARLVLSSGGLEPVADSGGGGHSVFAQAFLNALRENTGVLDGASLFSCLRRPVMLNSDQTPEYADVRKAGHEGGDFLFVRKK